MAKIDRATIDKIMDAANIVDVVGDFVSLKKRGSSYLGLCPFHNERTPSFSVNPGRNIFKCFSCGKAGNVVSFLMDLEGMSYPEAIKWLGNKFNIEVKERELSSEEQEADAAREAMYVVNEFALNHFEKTLTDTEDGRQIGLAYFRERGISDAMIKRFHLGYALDRYDDLCKTALAAGYSEKVLVDTGLAIRTDRGTIYDRFKGRVIYPVHSLSGRVVAFGGRTLRKEKTTAKYVNSPESLIYSKSKELYGIYQARNAIARKKECILVEGYMDVISMHQTGVENVVASSGTSLTEGQIRMIKRFANAVTLIYDSDPAGIKASLRGINMLLAAGLSLKVVLLPEGDDPDSFAQNHTSTEVEEYIEKNKQDLIGFKVDVLMKDSAGDPHARSEAINDIVQSISLIPDVVEQSLYIDEAARKVGVSADILSLQLKKYVAGKAEEDFKKRQAEQARKSLTSGPGVSESDGGFPPVEPPADMAEAVPAADAPKAVSTPVHTTPKAILVAERELIQAVIRRGMMYMCDVYPDPDSDEMVPMSILEYIMTEMSYDKAEFSHPPYKRLWEMSVELFRTVWTAEFRATEANLSQQRAKAIEIGMQELREKDVDMDTLEKLEKELNTRVDNEYNEAIDEFSSNFIHRHLIRSSDRAVTDLVAELSSDNIVLSKMFPKTDYRADAIKNIPLALTAFRTAVISERLYDLKDRIDAATSDSEANDLLLEYHRLIALRQELDKFNGEIVIRP